jgi:hypothetical protein
MSGRLGPEGWMPIRTLMIDGAHHQYVRLVTLAPDTDVDPKVPYAKVLAAMSEGGRPWLTRD